MSHNDLMHSISTLEKTNKKTHMKLTLCMQEFMFLGRGAKYEEERVEQEKAGFFLEPPFFIRVACQKCLCWPKVSGGHHNATFTEMCTLQRSFTYILPTADSAGTSLQTVENLIQHMMASSCLTYLD